MHRDPGRSSLGEKKEDRFDRMHIPGEGAHRGRKKKGSTNLAFQLDLLLVLGSRRSVPHTPRTHEHPYKQAYSDDISAGEAFDPHCTARTTWPDASCPFEKDHGQLGAMVSCTQGAPE